MKMFISWSGERSKALAHALRDWMPLVLHYVKPWLSEADVIAGERWAHSVATELEASNFGVICLTPENVNTHWILFEAGALAKSVQGSSVIPLLLDLEFSDISGPLAQFQAKKVGRSGLSEVIQSINQQADQGIPEAHAKQLFDALWPEFEQQITSIPERAPTEKHIRPQQEVLEELVARVRALDTGLRDVETMVSEERRHSSSLPRRPTRFEPFLLREFGHMIAAKPGDPTFLLILVSALRERAPWAYELGMEAYRAAKAGDSSEARRALNRLCGVSEFVSRGPLPAEEFGLDQGEMDMIRLELERFLMSEPSEEDRAAKPKAKRAKRRNQQ